MPGSSPPLASRARRADFQRTRQRIVAAARALMAERGPETLTVSAVAHAADINRTTAYQHFRTRDELVAAVTAEVIQEIGARIAEARPIPERIDDVARYFVDHPEIARLLLHLLLSDSPLPRDAWNPFFAEMRKLAATGSLRRDVDPEMLGHALMAVGMLWPLYARVEFETESSRRAATTRFTRELKRLLLYGLFRPEAWPDLVEAVAARPAPIPLRPKRGRRP